MRFGVKIFMSTLLIVLLSLCVGGTAMIALSFTKSVAAEEELVQKDNRMIRAEITALVRNYNRSMYSNEQEVLSSIINTLEQNWKAENKQYRIQDEKGIAIAENMTDVDFAPLDIAKANRLSYKIYKSNGLYFVQAAVRMELNDLTVTIENRNEITSIYLEKDAQIKLFLKIMLFVGALGAVLNFILSCWITKPIADLTDASKAIAEGNMKIRVSTKSDDEFGILANHFNSMADALEEKIDELYDAARRQENFVGSFAHEIKTPLTSIIGYADLLRSRKLEEEISFEASNYIFQEGKRLESLSIKLLELMVEEKLEMEAGRVPLRQLVEGALEALSISLREKGITVQLEVEEFIIKADKDLMKSVIINVLDNARKAVDSKGIIKINGEVLGEDVVLTISDNGRGIAKEDLDKITEAFYMADKSRARSEGGAGLGLAICTRIMQMHNGEMAFESELGKGTKVTLSWKGVDL
jgi:signal transduction histidine kinase